MKTRKLFVVLCLVSMSLASSIAHAQDADNRKSKKQTSSLKKSYLSSIKKSYSSVKGTYRSLSRQYQAMKRLQRIKSNAAYNSVRNSGGNLGYRDAGYSRYLRKQATKAEAKTFKKYSVSNQIAGRLKKSVSNYARNKVNNAISNLKKRSTSATSKARPGSKANSSTSKKAKSKSTSMQRKTSKARSKPKPKSKQRRPPPKRG